MKTFRDGETAKERSRFLDLGDHRSDRVGAFAVSDPVERETIVLLDRLHTGVAEMPERHLPDLRREDDQLAICPGAINFFFS